MQFFVENDKYKKAALQGMTEDKDPLKFSKNIIEKSIPELQELHDEISEIVNDPKKFENLNEKEKQIAKETLQETEEQMGEAYYALEGNDSKAIEQLAGGIYLAEKMGYFDKIALAGADVVDFIKEGAISFSGGNTAKNEKLKEAQSIKNINTQINPVNVVRETSFTGGSSPAIEEENLQLEPVEYTIADIDESGQLVQKVLTIEPSANVGTLYETNVGNGKMINGIYYTDGALKALKESKSIGGVDQYPQQKEEFKISDAKSYIQAENNDYAKTTIGYEEMFNARINTLADNIKANKIKLLDPNLTEAEEAELESLISTDRREKYQAEYTKTSQLKDLDYLVTNYLQDMPEKDLVQLIKDNAGILELSDDEILKSVQKLKEDFNANTVSSPRFLNNVLTAIESSAKKESGEKTKALDAEYEQLMADASNAYLGRNYKELSEEEQEELEEYLYYRTDTNKEGYEDLSEEEKATRGKLFKRFNEIDFEIDEALKEVDNAEFNPGEILINKIFTDYRKSKTLGSEQFYQIPEIVIDENSDKFSGGQFKSLVETSMLSRGSQNFRVFWDPSTRQSVELDPGGLAHSYTLDAYRTDNPRFAGVDQYGNTIIAFYRKSALTDQNKDLAEWQNYVKNGTTPISAATQKRMEENAQVKFSQEDLKRMEKIILKLYT